MDILKVRLHLENGGHVRDLPMRVVYYARVSTDSDEQLHSLKNQVDYFSTLVARHPNWTLIGGYVDEGLSGTSVAKRKKFLQMIDDARDGQFDYIITKEISRFSRNTLDSIRYTQELLSRGVGVFFEADNICTFSPDAELRLTIMASLAQDEVRRTSERVKFGFKRSVEQRRVLGADNTPGYRKSDGRLTVDETEAPLVRRVFLEYAAGKNGLRRIARLLADEGYTDRKGNIYSYASLRSMIANPKYKGFYCGRKYQTLDYRTHKVARVDPDDWVICRDERIPAIVTEEIWDQANELLRTRGARMKQHKGSVQSRYPYSGKIVCGEHNESYHRQVNQNSSGQRECWTCRRYRLYGRRDGCDSPTLYSEELNAIMAQVGRQVVANRETVIGELLALYRATASDQDKTGDPGTLKTEIARWEEKQEKLLELYMEGLISREEFAERNRRNRGEVERLQRALQALRDTERESNQRQDEISRLRNTLEQMWKQGDSTGLFACLVSRVVVHKMSAPDAVALEICLDTGQRFWADRVAKGHLILCDEIGISQAQVSRLEKNAFHQIKKYL